MLLLMLNPQIVFKFCIEPKTCHVQCFRTEWTVPADLPYFDGHFPSQPIMPAVAMVDASSEFLRQAVKGDNGELSIKLSGIKSAKFMEPITPGADLAIELHQISEREWSVEWLKLTGQALAHITLRLS